MADVSIFDHLKSTSAIAACLYQFHSFHNTWRPMDIRVDNIDKFMLAGGDLCGIQKYIYQISSITGEGGVAKRLRARSFLVSALVEVTVGKLLRALNLPLVCNIVSAGGIYGLVDVPGDEFHCRGQGGAMVGGWRTRVQAVDMWTLGAGGDSHIRCLEGTGLGIGPQRELPFSLAGTFFPQMEQLLEHSISLASKRRRAADNTFYTLRKRPAGRLHPALESGWGDPVLLEMRVTATASGFPVCPKSDS